ncbi:MAG: hypothetical protein JKY65_25710 [Planctomycetes bacterium]|nr:hypothetical protein [Planctomycetota bacterium]
MSQPMVLPEKGCLHAPFFVFLKPNVELEDRVVLTLLGLETHVRTEPSRGTHGSEHVYLTSVGGWLHVVDDWRYTLWNRGHSVVEAVARAPLFHTVFSCAVGDSDWSYGFALYESGELRRRIEVADPFYDRKRHRVDVDVGAPLQAELPCEEVGDDPLDYVLALARSVGVVVEHDVAKVRCYVPPAQSNSESRRRPRAGGCR